MNPEQLAVMGGIVFAAALLSLRFGITVAIFEIIGGVLARNLLGMEPTPWLNTLADIGALFLIFIAGTEINTRFIRAHWRPVSAMGLASFFFPFAAVYVLSTLGLHYSTAISLLLATASSTTSIAVTYPVLRDSGLLDRDVGKTLLAVAFVPDLLTTAALFLLFSRIGLATVYSIALVAVSIAAMRLLGSWALARFGNHSSEVRLRFLFLVLIALAFLSDQGGFHPSLAVFILGMLASEIMKEHEETDRNLRALAFSTFIPIFFFKAGLLFSVTAALAVMPLILALLAVAFASKFAGVYAFGRSHLGEYARFGATLMNARLTFGTIAATFGLTTGLIDERLFAALISMIILASVVALVGIGRVPAAEEEYA